MHILYLHQYFCPPGGGGNTRSLDFARVWVRAGHRVTILTSAAYFPENQRKGASAWKFCLEPGLEVHVLNVAYAHAMPFAARVRAFLRFYRAGMRYARGLAMPDVIYASSTPPSVGELGRKLSLKWGVPFVFETVDVWPDVPEGMGILRNRLLLRWLHARVGRIYAEAAHVVVLSEGMRAQVMRAGLPEAKISVVHNGTDPEQFPWVERPARQPIRCIYTGTVGMANGVEAIVDAAEQLQGEGIQFEVVGAGNALGKVLAYAEAKRLPNLHFRAAVPKEEVGGLLASADIGLVCFAPYAVLEANSANKWYDYLASGLPVVTNYEGWQAGYMREWDCGLSARQGDLAAFVSQIRRLAGDADLRAEMGRNGRRLVMEKFDRRRLAMDVLRILVQVLKAENPA